MASKTQTARTLLRYEVDKQSVRNVERENQRIAQTFEEIRLPDFGDNVKQQITDVRVRFAQFRRDTQLTQESLSNLNREDLSQVVNQLERVEEATENIANNGQRARNVIRDISGEVAGGTARITDPSLENIVGRRRAQGSSLDRIDRIGTIGSQIAGGFGGSEVGNAVAIIGDLADSVGQLGIAGGAASLSIAGVVIAFNQFTRSLQESQRLLRSALSGVTNFFEFLATDPTTQQANERIRVIQRQLQELEAERFTISQQFLAAYQQEVASFGEIGRGLTALTTDLASEILQQGADAATARIDELNAELVQLTEAAEAGRFAINDVENAERELAETRRQFVENSITQQLQTEIQFRNATAQQVRERLSAIEFERQAIEGLSARLQLAGESTEFLDDRLQQLSTEENQLRFGILQLAEARDKELGLILAANDAKTAANQALLDEQAAIMGQKNAYKDVTDQIARGREELTKLTADFQERQREAAQRLADAEQEINERRTAITEQYAVESARQAEDLADRLLKIQSDAAFDQRDAASRRDAVAFVQSKRAEQRQLDEAKDTAEKETRRRRQDNERRLREEINAGNKRLQQIQQANQRELRQRQELINAALNAQINFSNQELSIRTALNKFILDDATVFAGNLKAITAAAFTLPGTTPAPFTPGFGAKPLGGLTINVTGATTKQVTATSKQQAINVFAGALARLPLK